MSNPALGDGLGRDGDGVGRPPALGVPEDGTQQLRLAAGHVPSLLDEALAERVVDEVSTSRFPSDEQPEP